MKLDRMQALAYLVPIMVVLAGGALFALAVLGCSPMPDSRRSDYANLASGVISGGLIALVFAWIDNRHQNRQAAMLKRFEIGLRSDLKGIDFARLQLDGLYLAGKDLSHANLVASKMERIIARETILKHADLTAANLKFAKLQAADFSEAIIIDTQLCGADLTDANFTNAILRGSKLTDAVLDDATFSGADATGADFSRTSITAEQMAQFSVPPGSV